MKQLLFSATIYTIINEDLVYIYEPISIYTLRELQDLIVNTFPGEKTYSTKESGSKESLIKSTTNLMKFIQLVEM